MIESPCNLKTRPLDVLLVEDNFVQRTLMTALLAKRRHRVTLAENGKEAVEAVCSRAFDIVLMDVEMPTMDGLEATRRIRSLEATLNRHIPIVGLTTIDRQVCLDAGMDDHLSKSEVSRHIDAVLERNARSSEVEIRDVDRVRAVDRFPVRLPHYGEAR